MDSLALASRYLFTPIFDWIRGINGWHVNRRLGASQYFSEERIRHEQWDDLQRLLRYVYEHNKFYRHRFEDLEATPDHFKSLSDLSHFPVLSKNDIQDNLDDMISDEFEKGDLLWRRTGGSTGVPLQLYQDKKSQVVKEALVRRHDSWAGFLTGEKRAALWGDVKPPRGLARRVFNALAVRTIFLDTLNMDDESVKAFVRRISQTKTRLIFGHGHSIYFFARFLTETKTKAPRFDGIISSAETLTREERGVVEEVFGKVLFDRYGCEEIGLIASECEEHDGMHVAAEGIYVEIIDGSEQQPGRVIVTDLVNHGTPLIRYEIGDLAMTKTGACACGRGLPRIGRVVGRTSDILYTPEGKRISGISILDTMIIHIPGFRQVQVVQEKLDELVFNIVSDSNFSQESLDILSRSVTKHFGPSMRHRVNFVESIPLTGRGKFQFSICKVNPSEVQ